MQADPRPCPHTMPLDRDGSVNSTLPSLDSTAADEYMASSPESVTSSADTAMTVPDPQEGPVTSIESGTKDEADSSITSNTETTPPQDSGVTYRQQVEKFNQLKAKLQFSVKDRDPSTPGPLVFRWFDGSVVPSPAALYLWRRDQCRRYEMAIGSVCDRLYWQHFVEVNYEPHLHERIKLDQTRHEACVLRAFKRKFRRDHTTEYQIKETVEWIFDGVAEAVCRHTFPFERQLRSTSAQVAAAMAEASKQSLRNKKGFPMALFQERDRFAEEWFMYCRTQGSATQNDLFDYACYASHNPYSLYHKVKYGECGSPHPYIPFAITSTAEAEKAKAEQSKQELDAIKWTDDRRLTRAKTQREVEARAAAEATPSSQQDPATLPLDSAAKEAVSRALPDDVLVDQEMEQPQAVKGAEAEGGSKPPSELDMAMSGTLDQKEQEINKQQASESAARPADDRTQVAAATSHSHPITVSVIVPENLMPWIRGQYYQQLKQSAPSHMSYWQDDSVRNLPWPKMVPQPGTLTRLNPVINLAAVISDDEVPWRSGNKCELENTEDDEFLEARGLSGSTCGPRWSNKEAPEEPPPTFQVGNFFLSSCPGKKVRLGGPVRGRGAVCRDLGVDLQRFKDLGVGTLVCCMSDAELAVIGVEWDQYVKEADRCAIDIMRIPMVEGSCPTDYGLIDSWLNEIITNCTLKGVNVLVHCRGGVGRAGTLAACWLIKMGYVDEHRPAHEIRERGELYPHHEIMWQAIQVVRLRRSSKAIETAEQASFVAGFAEYVLQRCELEHSQKQGSAQGSTPAALSQEHCSKVNLYWARIRKESRLWIEQEQNKLREQQQDNKASGRKGQQSGSQLDDDGAVAAVDGSSIVYHSNINARTAAQIKTQPQQTKSSSPQAEGAGGTSAAAASKGSPMTSADSDKQSFPVSTSTEASAGVEQQDVDASKSPCPPHRAVDGEPKRKRRTTLSSAAIRLTEQDASSATSPAAGSKKDDTAGDDDDQDVDDGDAFPVTGVRDSSTAKASHREAALAEDEEASLGTFNGTQLEAEGDEERMDIDVGKGTCEEWQKQSSGSGNDGGEE